MICRVACAAPRGGRVRAFALFVNPDVSTQRQRVLVLDAAAQLIQSTILACAAKSCNFNITNDSAWNEAAK